MARFREAHREDPAGEAEAYHDRIGHWLVALTGEPSPALTLAGGCQHLCRWAMPRASFPPGRDGYRRWRRDCAARHAAQATAILEAAGAHPALIAEVADLVAKRAPHTAAGQALEDAACLVFIEQKLADFASAHDDAKVISVIQKTWRKMSPKARDLAQAQAHTLPVGARDLLARALAG